MPLSPNPAHKESRRCPCLTLYTPGRYRYPYQSPLHTTKVAYMRPCHPRYLRSCHPCTPGRYRRPCHPPLHIRKVLYMASLPPSPIHEEGTGALATHAYTSGLYRAPLPPTVSYRRPCHPPLHTRKIQAPLPPAPVPQKGTGRPFHPWYRRPFHPWYRRPCHTNLLFY